MTANPHETNAGEAARLTETIEQFRREHPLIALALESRCRRALNLPELGTLGRIATAAVERRLVEAIAEYQQSRGRR